MISESSWSRALNRRDVLKLGAALAAGAAATPLLVACAASSESPSAPVATTVGGSAATSGPITLLAEGDPGTAPAMKKVYDDFKAQNPAIEWDIRAIPGLGPDLDRLARAAMESGEPVELVILDGLFVRAWARDGLLADLGADPRLAEVLARVPDRFHLGGLGEATTRAFPLAVTRGVQTTGLYYNKALLDRAGLGPPKTIADLKAMVEPLAAFGVAPLVHPSGDTPFNPLLVTWLLPMIAERVGDPIAFVERTIKGEVRYDSPEWIETFETIADLRTSRRPARGFGCRGLRDDATALPAGKGSDDLQRHVAPAAAAGRLADRARSTCTSRRPHSSTGRRDLDRSWRGPGSRCRPRPPEP